MRGCLVYAAANKLYWHPGWLGEYPLAAETMVRTG